MDCNRIKEYKDKVVENVSRIIIGKENAIELVLVSFMCGGHILLEDVPGTGKTMLLRSFAKTIGRDFSRVQFTPDLLPSDLTGINFYNQKTSEFQFRQGPLFSNMILADEINRATPRTQSALLEAMEEKQITVDGTTYALPRPFMVLATENPLENYGTFPLPEAQIDRFLMKLSLGYPNRAEEMQVLSRKKEAGNPDNLSCVVSSEDTDYVLCAWEDVIVSKPVLSYIMDIVAATRKDSKSLTGISTRGAIAFYRACQAYAALNGRDYVIPEDVQYIAPYVLCHRIADPDQSQLKKIIENIKVPLE